MSPRQLLLLVPIVVVACGPLGDDNLLGGRGGSSGSSGSDPTGSEEPGANAPTGSADPLVGASAGGTTHVVSDDWQEAAVPYGDNVKTLNFEQLQAEVVRATGVTTIDWDSKQATFGGADYVSTFQEDRTPSATKMVALRKIAFDACTALLTKESSKQTLFSAISPKTAINATDPNVAAQVKLIFTRVFFEEPEAADVDASTQALADLTAAGATSVDAWTGLCVGYLSSMRFLSY